MQCARRLALVTHPTPTLIRPCPMALSRSPAAVTCGCSPALTTCPLRRRWLGKLEAELGPVPFRGDIHHATGPGFVWRALFEDPRGDWRLSGALGTPLGELPLWEDAQGERFLFLTKNSLGLHDLAPADKYLHPSQNWRTFSDR